MVNLYIYLLKNPDRSIVDMAISLRLSRTSLYTYLVELKNKGLAYRSKNAKWVAVDPDLVISSFSLDLKVLAKSFAGLKTNFVLDSYFKFMETKYLVLKSIYSAVVCSENLIFIGTNRGLLAKIKAYNVSLDLIVIESEASSSEFIRFFLKYFGFVDLLLINGSVFVLFENGNQALQIKDTKIFQAFMGYVNAG